MASAAGPNIITDGLVLHLDAANTNSYPGSGTTWTDISGKGHNGTLDNGPTFSSGNMGYISLDGTNDHIETGLSYNPNQPFSFTMVFRLDTIKEWHNLVDMFTDATNRNFQLFVEGDGDYRIFWGNPSAGSHAITSPTTVANVWYFGAFTCDGSTGTLYRYGNGTLDKASASIGSATYSTNPVVLGRRGDSHSNGYVNGDISYFQFYNKELTETQIKQNYNALRWRYGI